MFGYRFLSLFALVATVLALVTFNPSGANALVARQDAASAKASDTAAALATLRNDCNNSKAKIQAAKGDRVVIEAEVNVLIGKLTGCRDQINVIVARPGSKPNLFTPGASVCQGHIVAIIAAVLDIVKFCISINIGIALKLVLKALCDILVSLVFSVGACIFGLLALIFHLLLELPAILISIGISFVVPPCGC